mmetsp:Transcript_20748/g.58378  ORF Transcript_20748/g.58378 Transcript_20748/m.58378 type:complete len:252 (+) Transcript_20748:2373-3128(+)
MAHARLMAQHLQRRDGTAAKFRVPRLDASVHDVHMHAGAGRQRIERGVAPQSRVDAVKTPESPVKGCLEKVGLIVAVGVIHRLHLLLLFWRKLGDEVHLLVLIHVACAGMIPQLLLELRLCGIDDDDGQSARGGVALSNCASMPRQALCKSMHIFVRAALLQHDHPGLDLALVQRARVLLLPFQAHLFAKMYWHTCEELRHNLDMSMLSLVWSEMRCDRLLPQRTLRLQEQNARIGTTLTLQWVCCGIAKI